MSEPLQQILIALIPSFLTAVFTAWITVRLAIRQFHSQRWWEKKADAYSTILERLSELQFTFGEFWDDIVGVKNIGQSEYAKRLGEMHREAVVAIGKAAATGSFIVSDETGRILEELGKELDREDGGNPADDYERCYKALKDALPKIRAQAKNELRVK